MKRLATLAFIITGLIYFQGCSLQPHATVIEPDKNNACITRMIIQIGIDGNDSDVIDVREQLEPCFAKECFIPCSADGSKGCKVLTNVIVKKWSDLTNDEKKDFHHITMVPNDGLPSNAHIGGANGEPSYGTWRRNEPPRTYCHESLHLCGLRDQYCSRLYNAVDSTIIQEITCKPESDDPNGGNCCTPTPTFKRCSMPCPGHEHDLMATLEPEISCENILDVLKKAGFDKCPEACCSSHAAYHAPGSSLYIGIGYMNFGDKDIKFGTYGMGLNYTGMITPSLGVTLDGGYYTHTKKDDPVKDISNLLNISAGLTYYPLVKKQTSLKYPLLSTHALIGLMNWMQKTTVSGGSSTSSSKSSFSFNIGAALDWKLGSSFDLRLPKVDYVPSFFASSMQNNIRISGGLCYKFSHKRK